MKPLFQIAVAAAALSISSMWLPHASANTVACTSENFVKMTDHVATMPYGPKKMGMMREMAAVNTELSHGDAGGACAHYVTARRIQDERDPFASLHFE